MSQRGGSIRGDTHLQHTLYYAPICKHPSLNDDIAHNMRKPGGHCKRAYASLHDVLVGNKLCQDIGGQHAKNMRDNNPVLIPVATYPKTPPNVCVLTVLVKPNERRRLRRINRDARIAVSG